MTMHTEGPWIVNPFNAQIDCQQESEQGGLLPVCQMLWPTDERSEDETQANARLIAAAPDLLEALQDLCSFDTELTQDKWDRARAAITKATPEDRS